MFGDGERSATIRVEDGLWFSVDAKCLVDVSQPKETWPKCAEWVIVSGNKVVKGLDSKPEDQPQDLFIVDGTPPLIQTKMETNGSKAVYGFLALEAKSRSASGRITDADLWMVSCGIDEAAEGATPKVQPYPGFSDDCRPSSTDALRAAAAKGPAKASDVAEWKWVRAEAP
jgi:hypothetical protein